MPVAGAIVGTALSLGAVAASAAGVSTAIVIGLAVAGKVVTTLTANQGLDQKQKGLKETVVGGQSALPVIYGNATVGGSVLDVRVDGNSTDRRVLGRVIGLCVGSEDGSGINAINEIYFDDQLAVQANGTNLEPPFGKTTDPAGELPNGFHLDVQKYLGTHTQSVDPEMNSRFPTAWPTTSKLNGIAYIRFLMYFNKDVYPNGIPTVKAKVEGNRVFDPRDSTTKFSDNPALCVRDYLLSDAYGLALDASDLDSQSFIDAANFCDEFPASGPSPRFKCNGAVDTGRGLRQNLNELLSSCRGQLIFQGGKFRLHIPQTQTAIAYEITEDDIIGDFSWQRLGTRDTYTSATASYVDASLEDNVNDVTWPAPGQTNNAITEDGGQSNNVEIQLPFTTREGTAQIIAMVTMKESREDVVSSFRVNEEALQMEVGDVVRLTHENPGWDRKKFWVSSLSIAADGGVIVGLAEYDDEAYALDPTDTSTAPPGTNIHNPYAVAVPTNVIATSDEGATVELGDGTEVPRVLVTWTKADEPFLNHTQVRFRPVTQADGTPLTDQPWQSVPSTDESHPLQQVYLDQVKANWEYEVEVRSVSTLGNASDWVNVNVTVTPNGNQRPILLVESEESGNTGTVTCTAVDTGGGNIDLEWFSRTGQTAYPGTPEQLDTVQSGNSATFNVTLDNRRNTFVRVVATLHANNNTNSEEVTLDTNDTPVLEHLGATVDEDTGEVVVSAEGDADTENIYINVGEGSAPADPTPSTHDHQITGRSGTEGTGVIIAEDTLGFVKALPEKTSTGTIGEIASAIAGRGSAGGGLPLILVDTSETDSVGTLDATPIDPDGGTLTVRFFKRQGNNSAYPATPDTEITGVVSGTTKTETISLIEKKNSWIRCEAEVESSGDKADVEVAFDPDKIPEVEMLFATAGANGAVTVSAGGDSDVQSIDIEITGALTENLDISGRSGSDTTTGTLNFGETITITATPYTGSSETGTAGSSKSITFTRESGDTADPTDENTARPSIDVDTTALSNDPRIQIDATGTVGPRGSQQSNIRIEWKREGGTWTRTSSDTWTAKMYGHIAAPQNLFIRAVDTGTTPEKFSDTEVVVLPPLHDPKIPNPGGDTEVDQTTGETTANPGDPGSYEPKLSPDGLTTVFVPDEFRWYEIDLDGTTTTLNNRTTQTVDGDAIAGRSADDDLTANANIDRTNDVVNIPLDNVTGGTLTKGLIEDTSSSAGIRLDPNDTLPGTWVRYIDLTADAAGEFFIHHPALDLEGDGDATFSGVVAAEDFTATNANFSGSMRVGALQSGWEAGPVQGITVTDTQVKFYDGVTTAAAATIEGGTIRTGTNTTTPSQFSVGNTTMTFDDDTSSGTAAKTVACIHVATTSPGTEDFPEGTIWAQV